MSSTGPEETLGGRAVRLARLAVGIDDRKRSSKIDSTIRLNKEVLFDSFAHIFEQCDQLKLRKDSRVSGFIQKYRASVQLLNKLRANPDDFEIKKVIGEGKFGQVQLVTDRMSESLYAMKVISKVTVRPDTMANALDYEREILAKTESNWHTKLHYAFHDSTSLYLVMDYHPGGDLQQLLERQPDLFDESAIRFYAAEMVVAVHDLHRMGFIHRDVKPENVLIDRFGHLKLADFGSVGKLDPIRGLCAIDAVEEDCVVGTPAYVAPEILGKDRSKRKITTAADFWAIGVICYEMAMSKTPFDDSHDGARPSITFAKIQSHNGKLDFDSDISSALSDFVTQLLQPSPNKRLDYTGCIQHSFFAPVDFQNLPETKPPFMPSLASNLDTSYFDNTFTRPRTSNSSFSSLDASMSFANGDVDVSDLPFIGFSFMKGDKDFEESMKNNGGTESRDSTTRSLRNLNKDLSQLKAKLAETEATLRQKERALSNAELGLKEEKNRYKTLHSFNENLKKELSRQKEECQSTKKLLASERQDRQAAEAKMCELVGGMKAKWKAETDSIVQNLEAQVAELDSDNRKLKAQLHRVQQIMLESTNIEGESVAYLSRLDESMEEISPIQDQTRRLDTIIEEPTHMMTDPASPSLTHSTQSVTSTEPSTSSHNQTVKFVENSVAETFIAGSASDPENDIIDRVSAFARGLDEVERNVGRVEEMCGTFTREIQDADKKLDEEIRYLQQQLTVQNNELEAKIREKDVTIKELTACREALEAKLAESERNLREVTVQERVSKIRLEEQEASIKRLSENVGAAAKSSTDCATKFLEGQIDKMRTQIDDYITEACRAKQNARELEEKLATKEAALSRHALDLRIMQRELKSVEEDKERFRDMYKKLRLATHDDKTEQEALKEKIGSLQTRCDQLQRDVENAAAKCDRVAKEKEDAIAALKEQIAQLQKEREGLAAEAQAAVEKDKFIAERDARIAALEKSLGNRSGERNDLEASWEQVKQIKQQMQEKENQIVHLTKKCAKMLEAVRVSNDNLAKVVQECQNREDEILELQKKCENFRKNYADAKTELLKAKAALNEAESNKIFDQKNTNGKIKDLEAKISGMDDERKMLEERLRLTEQRLLNKEEELQTVYREYETSRDSLATTISRCSELTGDLTECKIALVSASAEKNELASEKAALESRIGELNTLVEALKEDIQEKKTNLEEVTTSLKDRERQIADNSEQYNSTIKQQNKLIEYLQSMKEEMDEKRQKERKGFGSLLKTKSHGESHASGSSAAPVTVIPRQYKELTRMLEEEKRRRMEAEQQSDNLKREMALMKGHQMPPAMHGTPVASTPGARRALAPLCLPQEKSQPTPQRVSHNIPHKFANLPVAAYAKKLTCSRCEKSISLSHGVKCATCHVLAHSKCAPIMNEETPFCGLTEEMIRRIADVKEKQKAKNASQLQSESSTESLKDQVEKPEANVFEGSIKVLANKRDWVPRWLRLDGSHVSVYACKPTNESQFPLEAWELCTADGHTTVTKSIESEELPAVHKTDLPFVFKLEKYLDTYVWPKKVTYYMAPSFDAKNEWVKVLETVASQKKPPIDTDCDASLVSMDITPPKYDLIASAPTAVKVSCGTMSGDKVIFGGIKGLYVVEFGQNDFVTFSTGQHGQVHSVDVVERLDLAVVVAGRSKHLFLTNLSQLKNGKGGRDTNLSLVPVNELFDVRLVRVGIDPLSGHPLLCAAQKNHINLLEWNPHEMAFTAKRRMGTNNPSVCGLFRDNSLIIGNEKFYEIDLVKFTVEEFIDSSDSNVASLTHAHRSYLPKPLDIVAIDDKHLTTRWPEFLLCYEDRAVFFDSFGRRSRAFDLKWTRFAFKIAYVEPYLFIQSQSAIEVIEINKKLCIRSPNPSSRRIVDYDGPAIIGTAVEHVLVSIGLAPRKSDGQTSMVDLVALTGKAFFDGSSSTLSSNSAADLSLVDSGALTDSEVESAAGASHGRKRYADDEQCQPPLKSQKLTR